MMRSRSSIAVALLAVVCLACSGQPPKDVAAPTASPTDDSSIVPSPGTSPGKGGKKKGAGPVDVSPPGTVTTTGGSTGGGGSGVTVTKTPGGVPEANLFTGDAVSQGITSDEIRLCAHAGLTLASLFGNDINQLEQTYWRYVNEELGGVHGRAVHFRYEDDGYNPNNTPAAFQACNDYNPAFMIGGIGFDQTPTFRSLAEQNKELYIHGMATEKGTAGLKYSFGAAPSVEYLGRTFAQVMMSKLRGRKIGILTVSSEGWKGGADTFTDEVRRLGYKGEIPRREIASNNDVLTSHVSALEGAGVEAVFLNINVLAWTRFVTEADGQGWHPNMVGFGFNLLTETVGATMRAFPTSYGLSPWVVYDPVIKYDWSSEYKKMQKYYEEYWGNDEPNDIDWIQWISMKAFHRLLLDCGKACNRNKIAGLLLAGYSAKEFPNCAVDFSRGRIGGYRASLWKSIDRGDTQVWREIATCRTAF